MRRALNLAFIRHTGTSFNHFTALVAAILGCALPAVEWFFALSARTRGETAGHRYGDCSFFSSQSIRECAQTNCWKRSLFCSASDSSRNSTNASSNSGVVCCALACSITFCSVIFGSLISASFRFRTPHNPRATRQSSNEGAA